MKKKLSFALCYLFGLVTAFSQDCSTDPSKFSNYVASGQFAVMGSSDDEYNDVVMLRKGGGVMAIDVLKGDVYDRRVLEKNVNIFPYDLDNVNGRMVNGDFDHDGMIDDFALIYKSASSPMKIDVFKSDNKPDPTFSKSTFLTLSGYNPDKVTGRVVSGDFDRDGRWDDIAMFYDYGGGQTRIHVFESTGSSFSYSGSSGWWSANGYTASRITNKVVAIDTRSGLTGGKISDILAFYDYGTTTTKYHIWKAYKPLLRSPYLTYSHHNFCITKSMQINNQKNPKIVTSNKSIEIESYPNPTDGIATLNLNGVEDKFVTIEVYTFSGVLVYSKVTDRKSLNIDLTAQPSGVYIVNIKVESSQTPKIIRIIKE